MAENQSATQETAKPTEPLPSLRNKETGPFKRRLIKVKYSRRKFNWFYKYEPVRAWIITIVLVLDAALIYVALFAGVDKLWPQDLGLFLQSLIDRYKNWEGFKARQWVSLITPVAALFIAWLAHGLDGKYNGSGIRHYTTGMRGRAYNLETEVIAASMTKQSVLAAIASILVFVIQAYPKAQSLYLRIVTFTATCGFLLAILFLLISMVCYDYASRFNWNTFHRAELVRKALNLDIWSWYLLLMSFVLSIAFISARLSILICIVGGILMWWYYFFRPEKERALPPLRGLSKVVIKVKNLSEAKEFYNERLGLQAYPQDDEAIGIRIGGCSEIVLRPVQESAFSPKTISFTISDDELAGAKVTLGRKGIIYCDDQKTKSIIFQDPDGNFLKLCAIN